VETKIGGTLGVFTVFVIAFVRSSKEDEQKK
jgi:hypothetical protein